MDTMASNVLQLVNGTLERVTSALDFPSARAVVFGVQIGGHLFVEALLFVVILFLLSQKSYKHPKRPLTKKEIDELCDEWVPESLIPPITEEMRYEPPALESAAGPHAIINGKDVVNFATANYLGLAAHEKLLESSTSALEKYGVGSCGPRGFYGTIDVHLDCEARIAKFLGTSDSILYSYGLSTMFSTIPCFCKKGDIIVVDEGVHWGIQNGLYLSRSTIVYFKHNDMESLRNTLEKITAGNKRAKELRRYIVVEAVYQNSGQIAPLNEIIRLKEKYLFRVLLDESNSFGVLGRFGRGLTEYHGVPIEKVDIVTAAMGHALATEGGFCTGSSRVIDHQRLSSSGYVFSASLPPYLASAAITAINVLEDNPALITKLKENISVLWKGLSNIQGLSIASNPESPIVFLKLEMSTGSMKDDLQLLEAIADRALKEDSVFFVTSKRSTIDKCRLPVGIRLFVSAAHSDSDKTNRGPPPDSITTPTSSLPQEIILLPIHNLIRDWTTKNTPGFLCFHFPTTQTEKEMTVTTDFSRLSDDVVLNILSKLEDDPRNWARLACVCSRLSSLVRDICWRSKCNKTIPSVVADLLPSPDSSFPGGWSALYKLAVCCPGLLHAGVLLDSDFGLERELGPDNYFRKSETTPSIPHQPQQASDSSNLENCDSSWSLFDDLYYDTVYNVSESQDGAAGGCEANEDVIGDNDDESVDVVDKAGLDFSVSKRRKVCCRSSRSHLASGVWNLCREQGNKLLASRFRGDCLYICDWPGCVHTEEKRNYMLFRGIFKNFKKSRVWRTVHDGNRSKTDLNCAFCECKETWDLNSAFCLKRGCGYHDDGEPVVRAYVCENGHVSGAWTDWPLYT